MFCSRKRNPRVSSIPQDGANQPSQNAPFRWLSSGSPFTRPRISNGRIFLQGPIRLIVHVYEGVGIWH